MCKKAHLVLVSLLFAGGLHAQLCTHRGQTPVSAVLVCGTQSFTVNTPTFCGQIDVPVPCPSGVSYQNSNPNFFRMNCFQAGTLGFTIVPDDATADYNWQLFDITNLNPNNIFTDASLFVACNWSSEPGETGASTDGTSLVVCSGSGLPLFSKMPDLQTGHTYLLMVSNHTGRPGNYDITFTGGTAVITDDVEPHLKVSRANCNGSQVIVRMNKKVKCESLAVNGSDFSISGGVTINSAMAGDCDPVLGSDSIILFLNQPISPGNYTITINNGSDGNTLTDICNRNISAGESIPLTVSAPQPTPMDSVFKPGCSPSLIELVFRNPIRCSSIAPNGSDFIITGPQPVTITSAAINCGGNVDLVKIIRLQLSSPITAGGIYQVRLVPGSDGNTIVDECDFATPANSVVSFEVKDTVSAFFTFSSAASCKSDTIRFLHPGGNGVNSWQWNFGSGISSNIATPSMIFPGAAQQNVSLTVSNGACTNTFSRNIILNAELKADFETPEVICPGDPVIFIDKSKGLVDSWQWSFGNGSNSSLAVPPSQFYPPSSSEIYYTIQLIAGNTGANCSDTVRKKVKALRNCFIAVPSAFTPNGDGKNDFLYPLNAYKALDLDFKIFNRYGQVMFSSNDWTKKWDGRVNGILQNTGVYAWVLRFTHKDSGEKIFMKGTSLLLR